MTRTPTDEERQAHANAIAERFAKLPTHLPAPTRNNTAVCMPTGDYRIDSLCVRGLMECIPLFGAFIEQPGCSHVSLARNKILRQFMASPFEWCVMIDSDIGFTVQDFQWLMQFDGIAQLSAARKGEVNRGFVAKPTDYAANAVYARKDDSGEVIHNGLGFARVHRSVFTVLGETLCMRSQSHGLDMVDYFPSGSFPNGAWMGEDAAFWMLCREIGVIPRRETRTSLRHAGRKTYELDPLMVYSQSTQRTEHNDVDQRTE